MLPGPWSWKDDIEGGTEGQEGDREIERSFSLTEIMFLLKPNNTLKHKLKEAI